MMNVLYNGAMNEQTYLILVTGRSFVLKSNDHLNEMRDILAEEGYDDLWDYRLDEINEVIEMEHQVVMVEVTTLDRNSKVKKEYRWFQVSQETVDEVAEVLKRIM